MVGKRLVGRWEMGKGMEMDIKWKREKWYDYGKLVCVIGFNWDYWSWKWEREMGKENGKWEREREWEMERETLMGMERKREKGW